MSMNNNTKKFLSVLENAPQPKIKTKFDHGCMWPGGSWFIEYDSECSDLNGDFPCKHYRPLALKELRRNQRLNQQLKGGGYVLEMDKIDDELQGVKEAVSADEGKGIA